MVNSLQEPKNTVIKNSKQPKSFASIRKIILIVLAIIGVLTAVLVVLWRNELRTLMSVREIMPQNLERGDGYVYEMTVYGDYYLDDFIAQGGVKSDKELIDFVTGKVTKGLFDLTIEEREIGCSSFAASTEEKHALFARNYDMTQTNVALVHTNPGGKKYKSISTIDLSFLGIDAKTGIDSLKSRINTLAAAYIPIDGMNEKGLAVGVYMTYQGPEGENVATDVNTEKPDITSTVLLRLMLDTADTVEEAVEIAKSYDMHDSANSSFHYMVADASGNSAILEWIGESDSTDTDGSKRNLKVIYNDDAESLSGSDKYQVVTNFIVYPKYYGKSDEQLGRDRFELIQEDLMLKKGVVKDEAHAMDILSKVGRRSWVNDDANAFTTHSVIYNLTEKTVYWVGNEHFGEEDYTLRLAME